MSKTYELWDAGTRNLVAAYASEREALAFVRQYVAEHGAEYSASWTLLWDDDDTDAAGQIAEGRQLLARALNGEQSDRSSPEPPTRRAV